MGVFVLVINISLPGQDLGHVTVGNESVTGHGQDRGQDQAEEARRKVRRRVVEGQRGKGQGQRRGQDLRKSQEGGVLVRGDIFFIFKCKFKLNFYLYWEEEKISSVFSMFLKQKFPLSSHNMMKKQAL